MNLLIAFFILLYVSTRRKDTEIYISEERKSYFRFISYVKEIYEVNITLRGIWISQDDNKAFEVLELLALNLIVLFLSHLSITTGNCL